MRASIAPIHILVSTFVILCVSSEPAGDGKDGLQQFCDFARTSFSVIQNEMENVINALDRHEEEERGRRLKADAAMISFVFISLTIRLS